MGDYLRQFRISSGYTIEEMAYRLKVYKSTIYKWEHGTSHPQIKNIKKIIDYIGYDPRNYNPLNINETQDNDDYWVIKIDSSENLQWQNLNQKMEM